MTQIGRSSLDRTLGDLETRVRALERSPRDAIFADTRILDVVADHVLFDAFPAGGTILELSWLALLDAGSVGDPCFAGLLLNGDATSNEISHDEDEYRWNVGISNDAVAPPGTFLSADGDTYFNDYGVVSWISTGESSWGRIRFPAYGSAGGILDGIPWVGDCAVGSQGNGSNPGVCSGDKDTDTDPLTAVSMIATGTTSPSSSRQQFAVGSWFALTVY